jgi:CheY-like chemotaxis protein
MADDSEDDRFLVREALRESRIPSHLHEVEDGEELMDYLKHQGRYAESEKSPRPDLVLLDLNMPRKSGREALEEIKAEDDLSRIPVVVLTTSKDENDMLAAYGLGVGSFITKPVSFQALVDVMKLVCTHWTETALLPRSDGQ